MKTKILFTACFFSLFAVNLVYGRWPNVDPKAESYYPTSPYAFCLNNPLKYVDPKGEDVWEINVFGQIVNRIEDQTQDAFYMVNVVGKRMDNIDPLVFTHGTIASQETRGYSNGDAKGLYDVYQVKGDENAGALFKFMANNITGISEVEIGRAAIGEPGENGVGFITTSHTDGADYGQADIYGKDLNGQAIRVLDHSHSSSPYPSSSYKDGRLVGDRGFATDVYKGQMKRNLPEPTFRIFHVPSQQYFPFFPVK